MAVVHKVIQDFGRMALDPLEILGSPIYVSIDGADIHEEAVSKLTREFSPHHSSAQTPPLRLEPTTKTAVWPWGSSGGGSGPG